MFLGAPTMSNNFKDRLSLDSIIKPSPSLMSSQDETSLQSLEDADMNKWFDFHKAEQQELTLWPLEETPLLWFNENETPDWDKDPAQFSFLWRQGDGKPIRVTGAIVPTNLFGRTAEEAFRDFPNDFCETPSPHASPSLSPGSSQFPESPLPVVDEASGQGIPSDSPDSTIDEMSQQLLDRVHVDSPPPPQSVSISGPLHSHNDDDASPLLSSPTCNPLSTITLQDTFSSSSSTLSVGTSSNAPTTYAFSPSPNSSSTLSSSSSPAPGLRRSPRRSPPVHTGRLYQIPDQPEGGLAYPNVEGPWPPPANQIVLEEHPQDTAQRRRGAKRGSYHNDDPEYDDDFEPAEDDMDSRPRKKSNRVTPKRHPCTVPGCYERFTRPNDVLRHIKNAAIHKGSPEQAHALEASSTLCKFCGEELSRADAARRHELKGACGKRTIRKKSTYSLLPA
ncbi:hypothetical protein B0H10DRAFT_2056935 [Mycena sp. CBHHK59/15]|nr:hypothetical protein B0H10DRAFT_2056935 [Mycena sp. CBHHK59/15]